MPFNTNLINLRKHIRKNVKNTNKTNNGINNYSDSIL